MEEVVAGAVLGATIKVVLQNLLSFHVEEISLVWNFNKDLQKLKKSIITIQNFLEDADLMELQQVTDKSMSIKRWLMKLEAVAYDAYYVFDELNYQLLGKKVETHNKMMKQVRSFFSSSNPIAFRSRMARKIKYIMNELKSIDKEGRRLGLQTILANAYAGTGVGMKAQENAETDSFSMDRFLVGREHDVNKIVEMVNNSPTQNVISVIPIVGMGGLGKTTLARQVFNDHRIVSRFEDRIWVYVSENFFPETVFKKIMASLTGQNVDGSREVVLRRLQESLAHKRCLLVLDNVWNEDIDKWDNFITSLEGISSTKGNVIIVTTRIRNVASIVKTIDIHELGVLSEEDCWLIIKAKTSGSVGIVSEDETIGRSIARRCAGLPLAAKVVGGLLRGKSRDEWFSIEKNWLSDLGGDDNTVSKILKLSYDNLSSPSLKKCFAYCSIIPKGWWIEKEELIDLWMAEGFLQTDQEKNMEIVGNKMFSLLVQSSLLQVWQRDDYGNVARCIMHDLVHDLALSVLNPKFIDDPYQARYICRHSADESSPILDEHAKCLHALFFSGKVSHIAFSKLKCLHVLILNNEDINELPVEIEKLISLRYLDISHTRIECLPNSIGDLYHLQTFRATVEYGGRSYLRKLPNTFKYLISLRHLYIPNIQLPPKIGRLISLQTLPYFQVGEDEGCRIMELGSLKNLKGEIEINNLQKVRGKEEAKTADLFHKPNIFKLKLVWNESKEAATDCENVLEGLQPNPNLKSLEINGFKGKSFPSWTLRMAVREELESLWIRLENLKEIKLSGCEECVEIPMLGHLPVLKFLYLHNLSSLKSLGSSFYGIEENGVHKRSLDVFPELERLELISMANLTIWEEVDMPCLSVFRRLEYLKISSCDLLMSAPSHFPCLKELEICNMKRSLPVTSICGFKLISLTKLRIEKVDELVCLPDELFHNNRDLLEVEIKSCWNLEYLVQSFGGGTGASSLKKLEINECWNFKELPNDLHKLNALEELRIWRCPNMKTMPSQGGLTSLRQLGIYECTGLTNLPCEMIHSCAQSLEELWLPGSMNLTNMPQVISFLHNMPRLKVLGIELVPNFTAMATEIRPLPSLQWLGIGGSSDCWHYASFEASLNIFFSAFQSLRSLRLYGMEHWNSIPDQLQHLNALRWLSIRDFGIEALPEWFGKLSSLRNLYLFNCPNLRHFPSAEAMQCLDKLTHLSITECPFLKQNLEHEVSNASQWSKISHIQSIMLDSNPISPHA